MATEYSADQIQILEGLEAVRKRPDFVHKLMCKSMWITRLLLLIMGGEFP